MPHRASSHALARTRGQSHAIADDLAPGATLRTNVLGRQKNNHSRRFAGFFGRGTSNLRLTGSHGSSVSLVFHSSGHSRHNPAAPVFHDLGKAVDAVAAPKPLAFGRGFQCAIIGGLDPTLTAAHEEALTHAIGN